MSILGDAGMLGAALNTTQKLCDEGKHLNPSQETLCLWFMSPNLRKYKMDFCSGPGKLPSLDNTIHIINAADIHIINGCSHIIPMVADIMVADIHFSLLPTAAKGFSNLRPKSESHRLLIAVVRPGGKKWNRVK